MSKIRGNDLLQLTLNRGKSIREPSQHALMAPGLIRLDCVHGIRHMEKLHHRILAATGLNFYTWITSLKKAMRESFSAGALLNS